MQVNLRRAWSLLLLCVVAWGAATNFVYADEPTQRRGDRGGNERNGDSKGWLGFGRIRALDKHERDHDSVKTAFTDVVSEPHKATVRVFCDDKPACLGTIIDAEGYIVTKASEMRGNLSVKLHDKRILAAELVGIDRKSDLAMLKIEGTNLPVISWRDVSDVPAVGSILASPGLETESLPIAIGVVSVQPRAISSPHGVLGIELENVDGAPRVAVVNKNSGADDAGLKTGDVIIEFNGQAMESKERLIESVREFQPGDRVKLRIKRGDEERDLTALLKQRSMSQDRDRLDFQNMLGGPLSERRAGFALALQHDTVLTPQDCGGPLVDLDGRCVGINIARAGRVNSYALPTSVVVPLLLELRSGKYAPDQAPREGLLLTKRLEELKKSESTLASKLTQVVESIQMLQKAADQQSTDLLKQAEAERLATETELGKVKAELEKIQQQKTSFK